MTMLGTIFSGRRQKTSFLGIGSPSAGGSAPIISGTAYPGVTLTSTQAKQWLLNGVEVSGQTGSSLVVPYTVVPGDKYSQAGSNEITVPDYDADAKVDINAVLAASSDWGDTANRRAWNKWLYSELISAMKTAGVYAAAEFRKCFMGPTTLAGCQACGIGGTIANIGPFVEGDLNPLGTKGNGINKYWQSNRAGNANAQNDFSWWVWVTSIPTASIGTFFGNGATNGASNAYYLSPTSIATRGKTATPVTTAAPSGFLGLVSISRNSSSSYVVRVGGVSSTITAVSDGNISSAMDFLARLGSSLSDIRVGLMGCGSNINGKEAALEACLQAYQTARALVP